MASRKNRSGKANRKSPKSAQRIRDRLHRRFDAVVTWLAGHRWHALRRRFAAAVRRQPVRRLLAGRATRIAGPRSSGARHAGGDEARHAGRTGGEIRAHRRHSRPAEIHRCGTRPAAPDAGREAARGQAAAARCRRPQFAKSWCGDLAPQRRAVRRPQQPAAGRGRDRRCRHRPPALQARLGAAGPAHPVVPALRQGSARPGARGAGAGATN